MADARRLPTTDASFLKLPRRKLLALADAEVRRLRQLRAPAVCAARRRAMDGAGAQDLDGTARRHTDLDNWTAPSTNVRPLLEFERCGALLPPTREPLSVYAAPPQKLFRFPSTHHTPRARETHRGHLDLRPPPTHERPPTPTTLHVPTTAHLQARGSDARVAWCGVRVCTCARVCAVRCRDQRLEWYGLMWHVAMRTALPKQSCSSLSRGVVGRGGQISAAAARSPAISAHLERLSPRRQ